MREAVGGSALRCSLRARSRGLRVLTGRPRRARRTKRRPSLFSTRGERSSPPRRWRRRVRSSLELPLRQATRHAPQPRRLLREERADRERVGSLHRGGDAGPARESTRALRVCARPCGRARAEARSSQHCRRGQGRPSGDPERWSGDELDDARCRRPHRSRQTRDRRARSAQEALVEDRDHHRRHEADRRDHPGARRRWGGDREGQCGKGRERTAATFLVGAAHRRVGDGGRWARGCRHRHGLRALRKREVVRRQGTEPLP